MAQKGDPKKPSVSDSSIVTTEIDRSNGISAHRHERAPTNAARRSELQWQLMASCGTPTRVTHDRCLSPVWRIRDQAEWTIPQRQSAKHQDKA
jgi:hypothetical protein